MSKTQDQDGGAGESLVPISQLPSVTSFADSHRLKLAVAGEYADALVGGQFVPKGLSSKQDVVGAIALGLSLGIDPLQAMQSIAVINGRPSIYGDTALGLCRASGHLEWITETIEGEPGTDERKAVCVVKRKSDPSPVTSVFSVADAKRAGLWGKQGPWSQYPARMLMFRARGFALRDGFGDVLRGLATAEEAEDIPAERDVTPAPKAPLFKAPKPKPPVAEPTPEPAPEPLVLDSGEETPVERLRRKMSEKSIEETDLIEWMKKTGALPESHSAKYVSVIGDKRVAALLDEWDVVVEAMEGGAAA